MLVGLLEPGMRVRVKRAFKDFDGREIAAGLELELVAHERFPHDEGHTLRFRDGTVIRLAGIEPANLPIIEDRANLFWEVVTTR